LQTILKSARQIQNNDYADKATLGQHYIMFYDLLQIISNGNTSENGINGCCRRAKKKLNMSRDIHPRDAKLSRHCAGAVLEGGAELNRDVFV